MEFWRGRGHGWLVIGIWEDNPGPNEELEPYTLELACELIADYPQKDGIQVLHDDDGVCAQTLDFSGGTSPFPNKNE